MMCLCKSLSCVQLCNPMDYISPGSSVHGIFRERKLEWVAISFSRGFPQPRNWTQVSCIAADSSPFEPPGKLQQITYLHALKFSSTSVWYWFSSEYVEDSLIATGARMITLDQTVSAISLYHARATWRDHVCMRGHTQVQEYECTYMFHRILNS